MRKGVLRTPPLSDRILDSITRARVLEAYGGVEEPATLADLRGADEAFVASTVREVLPVSAVDDVELPVVGGPVTQAAARALQARIAQELAGVPVPA